MVGGPSGDALAVVDLDLRERLPCALVAIIGRQILGVKLTLPYPQSCKTAVWTWYLVTPDSLMRKTFSALCHIGRDLSCFGDTHGRHDSLQPGTPAGGTCALEIRGIHSG